MSSPNGFTTREHSRASPSRASGRLCVLLSTLWCDELVSTVPTPQQVPLSSLPPRHRCRDRRTGKPSNFAQSHSETAQAGSEPRLFCPSRPLERFRNVLSWASGPRPETWRSFSAIYTIRYFYCFRRGYFLHLSTQVHNLFNVCMEIYVWISHGKRVMNFIALLWI